MKIAGNLDFLNKSEIRKFIIQRYDTLVELTAVLNESVGTVGYADDTNRFYVNEGGAIVEMTGGTGGGSGSTQVQVSMDATNGQTVIGLPSVANITLPIILSVSGVVLYEGVANDWTISGQTITLNESMITSEHYQVIYYPI